jgi:hypothetical protein
MEKELTQVLGYDCQKCGNFLSVMPVRDPEKKKARAGKS